MDKYSDLCKRMGIPNPGRECYAGGGLAGFAKGINSKAMSSAKEAMMSAKADTLPKLLGRSMAPRSMNEGGAAVPPMTKSGKPIKVAMAMPKSMEAKARKAVPMTASKMKMTQAMRKGGRSKCSYGRGEPQ